MVFRPRDLASRMAETAQGRMTAICARPSLPRDQARLRARDFLKRYPKAAYMSVRRELARAARRRHRVHDAAACQRGLIGDDGGLCFLRRAIGSRYLTDKCPPEARFSLRRGVRRV